MQGDWRRSVYAFLAVGLLFSLVSCGDDDHSTNTNQAGITSFVIEHKVDVTTIKSTLTPHLPPEVTGPIFSGAKEVRSRITFDASTGVYTNSLFLVNPGAPLPTPSTVDFVQVRFAFITVRIDTVYSSFQPNPAVMVVGVITDGANIYAPPAGDPYAFSFGYTTCTAGQVRDVVSLSAGLALLYQDFAFGTCTTS